MIEAFKIYIDRLKGGQVQKVEGSFDPEFLEIEEQELQFPRPVKVKGEAYVTDDHLVIHLSASTAAKMPCAVCNEMIEVPLSVGNYYQTEPLSDVPSALYDFSLALREALLIELPRTVECNRGQCPERDIITPFMRAQKRDQTTHFPFSDIDLKP
jgi:uncharacterized metal-binding protein YceD (DUF177 family)